VEKMLSTHRTGSPAGSYGRLNDRTKSQDEPVIGPTEAAPTVLAADSKLFFVAEAMRPSVAENVFKRFAPKVAERYGSYSVVATSLPRYKSARRCMIQFVLDHERGPTSILGKVSAKRANTRTMNICSKLREFGFGASAIDGIHVPEPIDTIPHWKMWLQEKVPGIPGNELLDHGEIHSRIHRIAEALLKLHGTSLTIDRTHTVADELCTLTKLLNETAAECPRFARAIELVLERCRILGGRLPHETKALIHRDFYQDQIVSGPDSIHIVDLDLLAMGDPSLDLGNFVAHLCEHGLRTMGNVRRWAIEEHQFLEHYLSRSPALTASRIQIWKAISFARHIAICQRLPDRRHLLPAIVDEALRFCEPCPIST
jgi:hypothetical protein